MEMRILKKTELAPLLDKIIADTSVVGVKQNQWGKYQYGRLTEGTQFCPDFDVTVQSPKRYVLPSRESILSYSRQDPKVEPIYESEPTVLWGVHPYDVRAINNLDLMFEDTNRDENYLRRRQQVTIVAIDPVRASEKSFWSAMDAATVETGFDLLLTDIGDEYVCTIGTEEGKALLDKYGVDVPAGEEQVRQRSLVREKQKDLCSSDRRLNFPLEMLPFLLMRSEEDPVWQEKAEKCFSCGSCNLVCPTCYCFDVHEDVSDNLEEGKRYRTWDGCLLEDFAVVAGGENFREARHQRYRHRFYRKGLYIRQQYGEFACVGCGRCASACLTDIADPITVYNRLYESQKRSISQ